MIANAIWLQNRYSQVAFRPDGRGVGYFFMLGFRFKWDLIVSTVQAKGEQRKVESKFQGQFN